MVELMIAKRTSSRVTHLRMDACLCQVPHLLALCGFPVPFLVRAGQCHGGVQPCAARRYAQQIMCVSRRHLIAFVCLNKD